jgi:hypothetical protein
MHSAARPACAALARSSSAGPRNARCTTLHGGGAARRRRYLASRRRHGAGARETVGNGSSPTRRRRRGATVTGERRARRSGWHSGGPGDGVVGEAVGEAVRATLGREAGGASESICFNLIKDKPLCFI